MNKTLNIRDVILGEGIPKICVPLVGKTLEQLKEEAAFLPSIRPDLAEWRADFFEDVEDIDKVKEVLADIRAILKDIPLIFTFRSAEEGGEKEVSKEFYFSLNHAVAETGQADVIDVELFNEEQEVRRLVETAHMHRVFVIMSNHDFEKTPPVEEIIARLRKAQELGADLPKIAVMPETPADVLTLLEATHTMNERYAERPIITMSMAGTGVISRLAGEVFGSAMTFGVAEKASAPGQIAAAELKQILGILHRN
ncbi:type I 3-dehydroquinate dehydratase [Bacillus sonorensis]|uniref:type I 3-dehydroquinate dehydratase n=1 Tax=Bacillus sonorensis TaxID=119858 RepID=UPI001B18ABEB|nr:type I 3-dehydroquinate dehydratase [Bacillus sonorensis]MCY7856004.1 type I 3-dehydroquinate dehydratase [Bacillus sonorensis]MCY8025640.1 type I 3-dehydroquinate dehydratase [Bacillus sonorensis]MCY8032881.1 type I 3-dehydroquinate dehydratase [Bacillus sonorensis]MCY8271471.1 type I 3-dehydroquinate dehydratase [Bacillus sonorensis]MCY8564011.1 type I 3-dehydroquinate dehydratase [Bacillus sonorensis]